MVLSDEIYSRLAFSKASTIPSCRSRDFKDRTILLDGFSKTYAMTGWRMGYGVMRPDLAAHIDPPDDQLQLLHRQLHPDAGVEAIRGDQASVDQMRTEFQRRRDAFVAGLNRIKGFTCRLPKGAFYAFPNITEPDGSQKSWPMRCLNEAGVAGLSGTAFGDYGEGYLRFSVANSLENLNQALKRIDEWTKKNLK